MTKEFYGKMFCPECGHTFTGEPLWKQQIRNHPGLNSKEFCITFNDCDMIDYKYGAKKSPERGRNPVTNEFIDRSVRWHMIIEVKCHDQTPDWSQDEQHWVTNQLLTTHRWGNERGPTGRFVTGHEQSFRQVMLDMPPQFGGQKGVMILSYGVHLLQMSGHDFASSKVIRWDNKEITKQQLVEVLRFDLSPNTLKPVTDRMHKREDQTPTLWDDPIDDRHNLDV